MNKNNLILLRSFPQCNLLVNFFTNETFVYWKIPQSETYISPFSCVKNQRFCNRPLKRIHLTCFSCKILRWVNGKIPQFTPIIIRQIWDIQPKTVFHAFLFRKSLSLTEFSS